MVIRGLYIVKKGNQGAADSTWAPFEETNNGPSHEQLGWLRERER